MHIGIVGGGILGITLGYFLSRAGAQVTIFEASDTLGGLAGPIQMDGYNIDRFYHAILTSDAHLMQLFDELGIRDQYRCREAKTAFYHQGQLHSMTNVKEFLTFPPLRWIDRFRLGLTIVYAKLVRDWRALESISVERWLTRIGGRRAFDTIWRPLLRAKFDGGFENTPATYIWARLNRVSSTRKGADQKEMAGHLIGGYITLIEAMAERIRAAGGAIHLKSPVNEIVVRDGRLGGLRTPTGTLEFDAVVATFQTPLFLRVAPGLSPEYRDHLSKIEYLGIVCPLLVLDRPLTGYWTLNITDERIPFTGVIETTSYIDPQYAGGNHLVYLPKYTLPNSPWFKMSDDEVRETWLHYLEQMFPAFRREWVKHMFVHRERLVEPIHPLNSAHLIPSIQTPVKNLYLATTGQIYPELTNGESVSQHARRAAQTVLSNLHPQPQLARNDAPTGWRAVPGASPAEGSSLS
ncbi:MAG TPA: NAD(P)/FAD-dependent oxidoreductase [Anaerolineae bacterium]|nr:NAD(P)/FAD-dependent oxidoreductase [Anaerolineae bacterium]